MHFNWGLKPEEEDLLRELGLRSDYKYSWVTFGKTKLRLFHMAR
jgi:hypothetical protein